MEKRITELGKSYWNGNGAYQKEYDELYKNLVPSSGEANTTHGEMIRVVSRLLYDFCNNGNCNVIDFEQEHCFECGGSGYEEDSCSYCDGHGEIESYDDEQEPCFECGGSGEYTCDCSYCSGYGKVDGDVIINPYYQSMINFLHENLINKRVVDNLEKFLLRKDIGYGSYKFDDGEMKVYNDLMDEVMHQVLTTKEMV